MREPSPFPFASRMAVPYNQDGPPMPRLIPRTIRGQLILGTALLQCLLVAAVFGYVYRQQRTTLLNRTADRLTYQVHLLSSTAAFELKNQNLSSVQAILDDMLDAPTIAAVRITDLSGRTLAYSSRSRLSESPPLTAAELKQAHPFYAARILETSSNGTVAVADINVDSTPIALAWVYPDTSQDQVDLSSLLRSAFIFALLAIAANMLFSMLLARSVTQALRGLLRGTKLLIRDPERSGIFPLKTHSFNEAGELTRSFNTMVAALKEQRAGLNDTLALLDSMLANAPIGFAFFDSRGRYVRVNQFVAEMDNLSISRHLGRTVQDIFPGHMAHQFSSAVEQVFATGVPVRDLELQIELPSLPDNLRTWLVSLYPVRISDATSTADFTGGDQPAHNRRFTDRTPDAVAGQVRWVGAVIIDATARKISEEMLRRTEKLAATGRLAASIAHEINNPLEAVTNLLYLLHQESLEPAAMQFAELAQQELARVSQITQQTLRFYRQSSKPAIVSPAELLESVLALHQGRLYSAKIKVDRRYENRTDLLAFSGELRQLFANLIGNALDAMPKGGRLIVSVRPSRDWKQPERKGVRIVIADTGIGMPPAVRQRIFEPFFTTKELTGTGLGLWISSEIIAKHQGTVRVRSRTAGPANNRPSGTVFMMFFPCESDAEDVWKNEAQNSEAD